MSEPRIINIIVNKTVRQINISHTPAAPKEITVNQNKFAGPAGLTPYAVAVRNGFEGTENEWLVSLKGPKGENAYLVWLSLGNTGTPEDFIASIKGKDGLTISVNSINQVDGNIDLKTSDLNISPDYNYVTDEDLLNIRSINAKNALKEDAGTASQLDQTVLEDAKGYAESLVVGLWDDRGSFNATINTYPVTGGSGEMGAILKGDIWTISEEASDGALKGYLLGTTVRAKVDGPGQAAENWATLEVGFGYVPENKYNKVETLSGSSTHQQYPTAKTVYENLEGKQPVGNYLTPPDIASLVDNNTALAYSIALS